MSCYQLSKKAQGIEAGLRSLKKPQVISPCQKPDREGGRGRINAPSLTAGLADTFCSHVRMNKLNSQGDPIRIVRVIDRLNIGGPAKHVVWLTAGLDADGFETTLITGIVPPGEGEMSYFARDAGITPLVIKEMSRELSLRDVAVIAKLLGHFWKIKPQIIHTHKAKAGAAGRIAALLYKWLTPSALWGRPRHCFVVHTYHGHIFHSYYSPAKTRFFLAIERALAKAITDRVIVLSEQQRREICERYGVGRPEQVQVIPLGLDFDEANEPRQHLRDELGIADEELLIGAVGRLCEVKNHALLLKAAAQLAQDTSKTASNFRLVIIGDGHLRGKLERLAVKLSLSDRVIFTGFRKDALSLYSDLDLVALTSLNEGTPLTLIEAMREGRALVSTEVGGVSDLMGARRKELNGFSIWDHGVTAPSGNAEVFARALQFLIEQADLRREMGKLGRAFVREHFSKDRLVDDLQELYRELLGLRAEAAAARGIQAVAPSQLQGGRV
jgi:glycosyltransferase involved in cell wall biosynthesis